MLIAQANHLPMQRGLSGMRLSVEEQAQILAAVERSSYDTPDSWTAELVAARVDLGANPGIVLRGTKLLCGGTGNCQLFVLRQVNGAWISLFGDEQAPVVESFEFGPDITHGIKNLVVVTHFSVGKSERVRYRFDGQFYRRDPTAPLAQLRPPPSSVPSRR